MNTYIVSTSTQLAQVLKGFRKASDITQTELAEQAGLLQKTISAMETDPAHTQTDTLFKLLSALNLELVLQQKPDESDDTSQW